MGEMMIGYSIPTILNAIAKQALDIKSEAEWIRFYALSDSATQIADIESCVREIKSSLLAIECELHNLKSEEM